MKKFNTSLYLRLSKEDEKVGESESISNQKSLLMDFVNNNEDLNIVSIKIDDGYSGKDFERPAFKELMEDIRNRKVDCIVVKDFSRFGRDFIEVGKFLEEIFPFMNVRFISVNDNYDSFKNKDSYDNLIVPFKNLINDSYLRDISLKVKSSLNSKRKRGEYVGVAPVYGYLKDPNNKNKIIVDEIAANVVRDIFKYRLEGLSINKISDKLNKDGILSPMEYKKSLGIIVSTSFKRKEKALWTAKAIYRILQNPIYIGTLEQRKTTKPNFKINKYVKVPKEEQIIIENNHQPIIGKELFQNIQRLMKLDTRISPYKETVYLLSGYLYCGECGCNLIYKNNGTKEKPYYYYLCINGKNNKKCLGASVRVDNLEEIVFLDIKRHIETIVNIDSILNTIDFSSYTLKEINKIKEQIKLQKEEIHKNKLFKLKVYEDFKNNIITNEEYIQFNMSYTSKIDKGNKALDKFENEILELEKGAKNNQQFLQYFKKYENIQFLTRELVVNLIEQIKVFKNKDIEIHYRYKNEYYRLLYYIKNISKCHEIDNG